jgi:hypothetical protein
LTSNVAALANNQARGIGRLMVKYMGKPEPMDDFTERLEQITADRLWGPWPSGHLEWLLSMTDVEREKCRHIRDQFCNDRSLVNMFRIIFPVYDGPKRLLYRGENLDRFECGKIGLCWTERKETAEMFGSGLNAIESGGVLLQCEVQPSAILMAPNGHSKHLQEDEYTVDPSALTGIKVLRDYAPSH